jgi:hypothetical protein
MPSKRYEGPARLFVATVRSSLAPAEDLILKVIILPEGEHKDAALHWRPIGPGDFSRISLTHVARGVYSAGIPAEEIRQRDIEYYVEASPAEDRKLVFPAGAPQTNQTVVIIDSE